jgi:hypothetical protein
MLHSRRHVMAIAMVVAAVAGALTLPAAAGAAAPTRADELNARSACAAERGLTRASHRRFRLKYGVGPRHRRAFISCVTIKARRFAPRRAWGQTPPPAAPAPAPAPPPPPAQAPALPPMPAVAGMPAGFMEMLRLQCAIEQMQDPIGFAQNYLGPYGMGIPGYNNPIDMCVLMTITGGAG